MSTIDVARPASGRTYPPIEPLPAGAPRPFWSVMIPAYNRVEFLERTLRSVLAQDPGPDEMQIEVVDDCSTAGDLAGLVRCVAGGRVGFHRQLRNVGLTANWTECVRRARGRWVHLLHDDDQVLPGFYAAYRAAIEADPAIALIFSRPVYVDEQDEWVRIGHGPPRTRGSGVVENALRRVVVANFICCPTVAVARRAYEAVGGFAPDLRYTSDWEMWARVAAFGPIYYVHQPCFLQRLHAGAYTNDLIASGDTLKEAARTAEELWARLPAGDRATARREGRRHLANGARGWRGHLHDCGDHRAALRQARAAFRLHPTPANFLRILQSVLRAARARFHGRNHGPT